MVEALLYSATENLDAAERYLPHVTEDGMYFNLCGNAIQKSIEASLRYTLELNAIKYPDTYDIYTLIDLLPDNIKADDIVEWETKVSKIKDFHIAGDLVQEGVTVACTLLSRISNSWLLEYLDASEIDDFYASIPSSIVVDKDNVEMLVSMYRSLK